MQDQAGNLMTQMPDSQIMTQMVIQAAQGETSTPPPNPVYPKITKYHVDPQRLRELSDEYPDVFPTNIPGLPLDRGAEISIPSPKGTSPLNRPMFQYSPAKLEVM